MQHFQELKVGDQARVVTLGQGNKAYRSKLLALGLTPGTEFTLNRVAPLGDPVAITVRNYQLTLRRHEAALLQIEKVTE